jgi:uncharacterized protein (DUF433 family)
MPAKERLTSEDRIISDPKILMGKPVIKGTRVAVEQILDILAQTLDVGKLFQAHPELTVEDVRASLAYAKAVVAAKGQANGSLADQGITLQELLTSDPTEAGISLRDYNSEQIAIFIQDDRLNDEALAVVKRFGHKPLR